MARAITSFPVPVSPRMRTAQSADATVVTSSRTALNFGLDPISSETSSSFSWGARIPAPWKSRYSPLTLTLGILALLPFLYSLRMSFRLFSRDPFADISRAVLQFGAVGFCQCQKFNGLAVHQKNVLEIDGHCALLLFEQATKHIHIPSHNPPADAQQHSIFSDSKAVDSAAHLVYARPFYSLQSSSADVRSTGCYAPGVPEPKSL